MVIVRRREDGLYYNGARSNAGYGAGKWTSDIQACLPYTNSRGAKTALGVYVPYVNCACPRGKGRRPWSKNCQHEKERVAEMRRLFDGRYEIISVRLELA